MPFESGMPTQGSQFRRYSVRFYMVALAFLIFDVEIVFFYPWAVRFREFGLVRIRRDERVLRDPLAGLCVRLEERSARMGVKFPFAETYVTTKLDAVINWSRKFSLFQYPFVTACCGMEFMAVYGPHYDGARFGTEIPRFTPRQADLLFVVGTVNHKMAPDPEAGL